MTKASCVPPDTYYMNRALYISPPMLIGKHEWCCVVYRHDEYGACTDYHWRKIIPASWQATFGPERWASEESWPRYDTNDTYGGLPRRLKKIVSAPPRRDRGGARARKTRGVLNPLSRLPPSPSRTIPPPSPSSTTSPPPCADPQSR
jgi:hypothetical protein